MAAAAGDGGGGSGQITKEASPCVVTFPSALRQREEMFPSPLRFECEEVAEDMNPRNMWQVYALGGFLVLRWIWARWKERTSRGQDGEDSST